MTGTADSVAYKVTWAPLPFLRGWGPYLCSHHLVSWNNISFLMFRFRLITQRRRPERESWTRRKGNLPALVKVTVSGTRRRLDIGPGSGKFFFFYKFFLGIVVDVRTLNKLMRQDLPNPDPFIRLRPKSRGTGFLRNICVRSKWDLTRVLL